MPPVLQPACRTTNGHALDPIISRRRPGAACPSEALTLGTGTIAAAGLREPEVTVKLVQIVPTALFVGLLTACSSTPSAPRSAEAPTPAASAPRLVVVHKSPTCGCCSKWEDHLRASGYTVESRLSDDMPAVKAEAGIPSDLASCHTATIGGYVVEGHVPADAIDRLLRERPEAKGLTAPGMPPGSPGMEAPGHEKPFDVLLLKHDGSTEVFQHVPA
jgi:hypothetical protein